MSEKKDFIKLTYPPGYGLELGFDTPPDPQVVPADLYDDKTLDTFSDRGVTITPCDKKGVSTNKNPDAEAKAEADAKAKAEADAKAKAEADAKAKAEADAKAKASR